jgi:hypothetical protein
LRRFRPKRSILRNSGPNNSSGIKDASTQPPEAKKTKYSENADTVMQKRLDEIDRLKRMLHTHFGGTSRKAEFTKPPFILAVLEFFPVNQSHFLSIMSFS